MQITLNSCRIINFKSIKDTEWFNLSIDNITGLIGQNESGKTSILEGLYSFSNGQVQDDHLRSDRSLPEISCRFFFEDNFVSYLKDQYGIPDNLVSILKRKKQLTLTRKWVDTQTSQKILVDEDLKAIFIEIKELAETQDAPTISDPVEVESSQSTPPSQTSQNDYYTEQIFLDVIFSELPQFEYFENFSSLLPNQIDLEEVVKDTSVVEGHKGAKNFIKLTGLNLSEINTLDNRIISNAIDRINKKITNEFRTFWTQQIGKQSRISIQVELKNHPDSNTEKLGKPYLVFWIKDNEEKLYPKQRSTGVRWFLSFFLQMKSSSIEQESLGKIFLIDEPGGSLHARAQADVLKLFEDIKEKVEVIYTTHSPYLINIDKLYRLVAVQRANQDDEKSETLIFDAHSIGAASRDTLSPIYSCMGVDFSHQNVIKKNDNVILEEVSAFYYLKSFWKLTNNTSSVQFLPATGAPNIIQLVNLMTGWGLDFIVVVDDDSAGRKVYNELKKNFYLDDETKAKEKMLKIPDCNGIEDIFTVTDFKNFVILNKSATISTTNSDYMKVERLSKPITAAKFSIAVETGVITMDKFTKATQDKITNLVTQIQTLLINNHPNTTENMGETES